MKFFTFIHEIFDWRFFAILAGLSILGLALPEKRLKLFRSIRFNVVLFLVIAAAASAGSFLPAERQPEVYHAWWFSGLLALMTFDVVVCKLRGLPKLIHGPVKEKKDWLRGTAKDLMSHSKLEESFASPKRAAEAARTLRQWLKSKNLRFIESRLAAEGSEKDHGHAFFAGRHRAQRWGDFILHISIVVILTGGLLGAIFGFEEMVPIVEGETVPIKNRPFDITLNSFDIEYYAATGAPSLYASELEVRSQGTLVARKRIVVNDPLDIRRVRFYQASWGMTEAFRSATVQMAGRLIELKPNEIKKIPHTPFSVRASRFLPSFQVDEHGHPLSADYEGRNPAVLIDFLEGGDLRARVWLLKNRPGEAFQLAGERAHPIAPPPFQLVDVRPVLFSGIQVAYDPGAPVFWIGAVILLLGLSLQFYLHQRRLRIVVTPRGAGSEIVIGGWNSRASQEFKPQFLAWVGEIRKSLGPCD